MAAHIFLLKELPNPASAPPKKVFSLVRFIFFRHPSLFRPPKEALSKRPGNSPFPIGFSFPPPPFDNPNSLFPNERHLPLGVMGGFPSSSELFHSTKASLLFFDCGSSGTAFCPETFRRFPLYLILRSFPSGAPFPSHGAFRAGKAFPPGYRRGVVLFPSSIGGKFFIISSWTSPMNRRRIFWESGISREFPDFKLGADFLLSPLLVIFSLGLQ